MQYREQFDGSEAVYTVSTALECDPEDDFAVQDAAGDADINTLVRRYHLLGEMPPPAPTPLFYGDFSEVPDDYASMTAALDLAAERFGALPAEVRARFANDPSELIDFVQDPNNRAEAEALGLLEVKPPDVSAAPPSGGTT